MIAGIPYRTFPDFDLGPLTIRSFGLLVGIGVLLGAWLAARYIERWGVPREETYRLATRLVVGGVIGSRLTWVFSHLDQIDSPIDLIAVWEGGIQFSGGFIAAVIIGFPTFRKWSPKLRWRSIDGYAYGLTIGLAIGRIGCYSVGEHFGRLTSFPLGVTYEGGETQEDVIGDLPLQEGMTFHHTALYELMHLVVLFGILTVIKMRADRAGRELAPGTLIGIFCVWYGIGRFATDLTRSNDATVLGMTGAQFMCLALVPVGAWLLLKRRKEVAELPDDPAEVERIRTAVLARAGVAVDGGGNTPAAAPAETADDGAEADAAPSDAGDLDDRPDPGNDDDLDSGSHD